MKSLIGFELKKIFQKKIVWITFVVFLVLQLVNTCFAYFISSRYADGKFLETNADWYKTERKNAQDLSGRKIDDSLLTELADSYQYKAESEQDEQSYEYLSSDDYQNKVRPYKPVDLLVRQMLGEAYDGLEYSNTADITQEERISGENDEVKNSNALTITQDVLYKARRQGVERIWDMYKLSDAEKKYWSEKEDKLPDIFTYQYGGAYTQLVDMGGCYYIFMFMIFFIAICLQGIFIDEHVKKTDQIILCKRYGRKESCIAKMAAGSIVTVCVSLIYWIVTFIAYLGTCGLGEFSASVQVAFYSLFSENLSIGQIVLIMTGILLLASVVLGIITMALSELLNSSVGTMAVIVAFSFFVARLVQPPLEYKFFGKLWNMIFPINLLKADEGFFDVRLWNVFGIKLTQWQLAPFIYIIAGIIFFLVGMRKYCRYQVGGR